MTTDEPETEAGIESREWTHPRYATALTGAAYNLLAAIENGDRANVHGWSVALRKELDDYLAGKPIEGSDPASPEAALDVERLARAMWMERSGSADALDAEARAFLPRARSIAAAYKADDRG